MSLRQGTVRPSPSHQLSERVQSLRLPPEVHRGGGSKVAWVFCGILALAVALLVSKAVRPEAEPKAPSPEQPAKAVPNAPPRSPAVAENPGRVALQAKGYIVPFQQILVTPKVSGMLTKLNVEEGRRIEKGHLLAEIEDTEYRADCERAEAAVAAAEQSSAELERGYRPEEKNVTEAELKEVRAERDYLKSAAARNRRLYQERAIAKEQYEEVESKYWAMEHRVARLENSFALMVQGPREERKKVAKADLERAKAELVKARWRWDNCKIFAPISGTILKKNAEEGNIVNPIAFNGSFSICEMADLSKLEVDVAVQERDIATVEEGQKCEVRTEAYPDRVYTGYVSRKMPIADRAKGTISIRVKVEVPGAEEGKYLKPEMGALVTFLRAAGAAATSAPPARLTP